MFFDFSWSEIFVVAVVALIVIGPKEIPKALRALGQIVGKLRRTADEFRRHFDETMREAGAEDLQREIHELRHNNPISEIRNTIENTVRDATNPASLRIDEPASGGHQPQAGAQTPAEDAKASPAPAPASSPAPEQAPAPTDNSDPANNDKTPLK